MAIRTYYESYWSETGFHPSGEESTRLYRAAEARLPSLLGYRLHAIATKPGPMRDPLELGR